VTRCLFAGKMALQGSMFSPCKRTVARIFFRPMPTLLLPWALSVGGETLVRYWKSPAN
jgi:hypothetical protein